MCGNNSATRLGIIEAACKDENISQAGKDWLKKNSK
jgi:hypothetical protein